MVQAGGEHHIHPGHRISLSAKAAPSAAVGGAGTRSISSEPDELAIVLDRRTANRCCPRHRQRNADRLTAGPHKEISWSGRLGSGSRTANPVLVDHSSRSHCIGTTLSVPMALMRPLVGTATSVRRRFMGRPRCQTLAIAPLVTQRSRHRFLRRNPRQPQQACYFLDNQLGTYAVPSDFSVWQ
jgi:hypothetical protein